MRSQKTKNKKRTQVPSTETTVSNKPKTQNMKHWIPEIEYESDESGEVGNFPLINVVDGQSMPLLLWIWEQKDTKEFEVGSNGKQVPIFERDLHQYIDMKVVYNVVTQEVYDKIRSACGLKPLQQAKKEGHEISKKIIENVTDVSEQVNNAKL